VGQRSSFDGYPSLALLAIRSPDLRDVTSIGAFAVACSLPWGIGLPAAACLQCRRPAIVATITVAPSALCVIATGAVG
jgi:hypothetical protein